MTGVLRSRYVVERNLRASRRFWLVIVSGFFEPLFYLFSIGIGLGQLVGDVSPGAAAEVSYAAFIAPGLLAASAMNGAVMESTNVFFKFRYAKTYHAILATPMAPAAIVAGEIVWSQLRGLLYAGAFLGIVAALGLVLSTPGLLLALPAALLVGFAFAAAGVAASTFMRSYLDFDLVQLVVLPLFLFSATFFPLEVYPAGLRWLVQLSPLYHGVALLRSVMLGTVDVSAVGHIAYLTTMGLAGLVVAGRRLERLLLS